MGVLKKPLSIAAQNDGLGSPVVSRVPRYATTVRIVPAQREGSVLASSATGPSTG